MASFTSLTYFLIYRLMTLSSFFGVIVFYLIATQDLTGYYNMLPPALHHFWLGVALLLGVFVLLSWLTLKLASSVLPGDNTMKAIELKPIESTVMPTYIGMFVIALGMGSGPDIRKSAAILLILLLLWGLFERVFYFNPGWMMFGYRFYEARDAKGTTFTLITRRKNLKGKHDFADLRKINEYTYLEDDRNAR